MGFIKHRRPVLSPVDNKMGQMPTGDYSLSEVDTGAKWIDGSTIYRQTFNMGALPDGDASPGAQASKAHGITGLGVVIRLWGMAVDTTGPTHRTVNYNNAKVDTTKAEDNRAVDALVLEMNNTAIAITTYADWTTGTNTAFATAEYTKT